MNVSAMVFGTINILYTSYLCYDVPEYVSPKYEKLAFDLFKERLVLCGHSTELLKYEYDPSFTVR